MWCILHGAGLCQVLSAGKVEELEENSEDIGMIAMLEAYSFLLAVPPVLTYSVTVIPHPYIMSVWTNAV